MPDWMIRQRGLFRAFGLVPAAWAIVLVSSGLAADEGARTSPNIVVILVDDLGYGDLRSFNPDSKIATPHLDRLASEGMRFTDAHAPGPLCHPSRYGLMTGRYPFRTDVSLWPRQPLIEDGQVTLASLLSAQGYSTSMVGKWHLGFLERGYDQPLAGGPVDRGFDQFFGIRASTDIPPYFYIRGDRAVSLPSETIEANRSADWSPIQGEFWREGGIAPGLGLAQVMPDFTDEACKVILRHRSEKKPLFLYLAYPAPHTPWLPEEKFVGKSGAGMYGDFVMMVDDQIGRVLKALDEARISEETLVIFTSDNGPVWYDKDVDQFSHDSVGGLKGMKGDAWEGGHRMPFIVRWPGRVAAGSSSGQTICFTDLLATFAEICGVEPGGETGPDSFSILPVLEGRQAKDEPIRGPIVMQAGNFKTMMIRSGDWKLINRAGSGGFSKSKRSSDSDLPGQLYNLKEDPSETKNRYREEPERVDQLLREMKSIQEVSRSRPHQ